MTSRPATRISRATRTDVARKLAGHNPSLAAMAQVAGHGGAGITPATHWSYLTGEPYPQGIPLPSEADAMGLPPFGRGVALLANAVAGTSWRAMRWDPVQGVDVRIPDQPAVLVDPDPTTDPWQYRWSAVEDLILYGNHFALFGDIDFRTLRPGWLVPLPAHDVWIIADPETGAWSFTVAGEMFGADELLHVSAGNRSGAALGRGALTQYAEALGGVVAADSYAGSYFAGGTLPPAVLQSPTVLTQDQGEELKVKWRAMTTTREPVVLPMGYVLTPVVSNAEQAQLVESRQWNAAAVAMMLGIPSYKLGLAGPSMTYQNIESADIEFVRDSVDRYAHPLSESFSKWLMPRGTTVAWDYAGRMRADQSTLSTVLTTYTGAGVLTIDEARAMIGRAPLPAAAGEPAPAPEPEPTAPDQLTPEEVLSDV